MPGSVLKVCVVVVVVGGGGGGGGLETKLSDQLWLSFSLALAKPNKIWKSLQRLDEGSL
jgi:acetyl-CoA carboxylase alpha subunit